MTKARTLADNFAADINGITAGTGITGGGTSGTVTVTNSMATAIDAKGDLVVGTGADTFSRLAVASTAGYLLSVDSGETTGLKWAAPAGGGKVLQVVSGSTTTETVIASTTLTDSTLSATITPTLATSQILILVSQCIALSRLNVSAAGGIRLLRASTSIYDPSNQAFRIFADPGITTILSSGIYSIIYLDSPSTTSATTYKTQLKTQLTTNSGEIVGQPNSNPSTMILMEIGA